MAQSGNYQAGYKAGQNPNAQQATPQQIPNAAARADYNKGVADAQKKK